MMTELTLQEVFDRTAIHLLTQGGRAVEDDNIRMCRYRGVDGRKCAAGYWIADAHYEMRMEGTLVPPWEKNIEHLDLDEWKIKEALKAAGLGERTWSLLKSLQDLHDHAVPGEWLSALEDMAAKYGVSAAVLNKFKGA